jgi:hypothetical protein
MGKETEEKKESVKSISSQKEVSNNLNISQLNDKKKNNDRCYLTENEDNLYNTKQDSPIKLTEKTEEVPNSIKSSKNDIQKSLDFSQLNDEQTKYGNSQINEKMVSKFKEMSDSSDDDDSDDDIMGFSDISKINKDKANANNKQNAQDNEPFGQSGRKSPLDLKINQNISKSLKQTKITQDSPSAAKQDLNNRNLSTYLIFKRRKKKLRSSSVKHRTCQNQ